MEITGQVIEGSCSSLCCHVLLHTGFAAELGAAETNHTLSVPGTQTPKRIALLLVPCLCTDLYHKFCWITSTLSYVLQ